MFYPPELPGYKVITTFELWCRAALMALAMVFCFLVGWTSGPPVAYLAFPCGFLIQAYGVLFGTPDPSRVRLRYAWLNGKIK